MATIIHTPRNTSKRSVRFDANTKDPSDMPMKDPKGMPTPNSTPAPKHTPTPTPNTY